MDTCAILGCNNTPITLIKIEYSKESIVHMLACKEHTILICKCHESKTTLEKL